MVSSGWSPLPRLLQALRAQDSPPPSCCVGHWGCPWAAGRKATHIPQVEGDLQVGPEVVGELRVHVQHLQQVLPVDLVQVAVGQSAHVCVGLARACIQVEGLPEDVVLPWGGRGGSIVTFASGPEGCVKPQAVWRQSLGGTRLRRDREAQCTPPHTHTAVFPPQCPVACRALRPHRSAPQPLPCHCLCLPLRALGGTHPPLRQARWLSQSARAMGVPLRPPTPLSTVIPEHENGLWGRSMSRDFSEVGVGGGEGVRSQQPDWESHANEKAPLWHPLLAPAGLPAL